MSEPPSGKQYEIRFGSSVATLVEVGAGLRECELNGCAVLDGFSMLDRADGGRGQPLLPWPNRIVDGLYEFEGETHQLPIDEVSRHNAMHGLTRWLNWSLLEHTPNRVRLGLIVHPRPGYPFTLALEIDYSLGVGGLRVRTIAQNRGDRPLPFGAGQHPYFSVGTARVDESTLHLSASHRLEMDSEHLVPTGVLLATRGTQFDFSAARTIGSRCMDDCFTDLARDVHGRARATLSDPASGRAVTLWVGSRYRYVQVFTGDTLSPDRQRRGLAIEPMTCPANAFRSGLGLIVLHPEEAVTLEWGITTAA